MVKKILKKIIKNERGFTLVELMVVVSILAILSSIAIPRFTGQKQKAEEMKTNADIAILQNAVDMYFFDHGVYPDDTSDLVSAGYLREDPVKNDGDTYDIGPDGIVTE
ncbi:MAG: competence type IV pilus major pilin ComGC [Bacillota bacterium]